MNQAIIDTQPDLLASQIADYPEWFWMVCLPLDPLYVAAVPLIFRITDLIRGCPHILPHDGTVRITTFLRWSSEDAAIDAMAEIQRRCGKSFGLQQLPPVQQAQVLAFGRRRKYALASNFDGTTAIVQLLTSGARTA